MTNETSKTVITAHHGKMDTQGREIGKRAVVQFCRTFEGLEGFDVTCRMMRENDAFGPILRCGGMFPTEAAALEFARAWTSKA